MSKLLEIRWHGRGGQGVVTASKALAQAAIIEGAYVQAFPEYGAERTGAPIQSFTRIGDTPIDVHSQITNPDIVVVLDDTLLGSVDMTAGLKEGGKVIINTSRDPKYIKEQIGDDCEIYTIDANKISEEELGRVIPNTPMLGALIKASEILQLDNMLETLKQTFGKKFSEKILNGNLNAVKRAYSEVKKA
jgi:pyruvate ferredoxin oxidoreductase gamma subunit